MLSLQFYATVNVIVIVFLTLRKLSDKIIVSALTIRPKFSAKIEAINKLLSTYANSHNYIFLDNSQIRREHLCKDKLHLNDEGIISPANKFLILYTSPPLMIIGIDIRCTATQIRLILAVEVNVLTMLYVYFVTFYLCS